MRGAGAHRHAGNGRRQWRRGCCRRRTAPGRRLDAAPRAATAATATAAATADPAPAAEHAPQHAADDAEDREEDRQLARPGERPQVQVEQKQPGAERGDDHGEDAEPWVVAVTLGPVLPGPVPAAAGNGRNRQRRRRRHGVWKILCDLVQLALRDRLERGVQALVELLQREPALCIVLAQAGCGRFALGVPDAKLRSRCHVVLRGPLASELDNKTIYLEEIVGKSSHPSPENIPAFVPGGSRLLTVFSLVGEVSSGSSRCRRFPGW